MHLQVFRPQLSNHKMITYSSTNCRALAWRLLFSPFFFFFLRVMAEKSFLLPSVPNKKPEVRSLSSVPMSSYPNCSDWFNCLPPLSCCCISQCNSFLCQKRSQRCEGQVVGLPQRRLEIRTLQGLRVTDHLFLTASVFSVFSGV